MGAGRIGALYDSPGDAMTLTHCHAYANSPRFELAGVVDSDPRAARAAASRWTTSEFTSLADALAATKPDVVSVCTPARGRREIIEAIVASRPRFVFLEKPVASDKVEADAVAAAILGSGVDCMVNYPRLFDTTVIEVARAAAAGEYGPLISGVACYSKGLRNNGSHLITLVQRVSGEIREGVLLDEKCDFRDDDPSASALLRLASGASFFLVAVDERAYSIIDVTFFFRDARIHFRNFGLEVCVSRPRNDPVFAGYRDLASQDAYAPTSLGRSLDLAAEQIARRLDNGSPFASDLDGAMRAEGLIDRIMKSGVKY